MLTGLEGGERQSCAKEGVPSPSDTFYLPSCLVLAFALLAVQKAKFETLVSKLFKTPRCKMRLPDLSKMFPRFRDPAKIFRDPPF